MVATPRHDTLRGRPLRRPPATLLGVTLAALAVAGCGGGGSSSSSATSQSTSATSTAQATTTAAQGGTASVTAGPVRGALRGENHAPAVKRPWSYAVTVTDAGGHPLSGKVEIEFVYGGQVVGRDTPPTHPVTNGHWHDRVTFPAPAIGMPLTFRAVVHTARGSITLDWPIQVRP